MIPLFRERPRARPTEPREARETQAERIDDVVRRVAGELAAIGAPLPAEELDARAHAIVEDVARFVLRWVEGPGVAEEPARRGRAPRPLTHGHFAVAGPAERAAS